MAERILKDNTGKIWVNNSGQIIKEKPFNETIIQSGLVFHGAADPAFLTITGGLVSEAYDLRTTPANLSPDYGGDGTGLKMTQTNVANRLEISFISNKFVLTGLGSKYLTSLVAQSFYSVFIVGYSNISSNYNIGYGHNYYLGSIGTKSINGNNGGSWGDRYVNNVLVPTNNLVATGYHISACNVFDSTSFIQKIGNIEGLNCGYILEWFSYNRVLNVGEIIYNTNALNQKYNIF